MGQNKTIASPKRRRSWFTRKSVLRWPAVAGGLATGKTPSQILVLAPVHGPTLEVYLPRIKAEAPSAGISIHDSLTPPDASQLVEPATWVVIMRHADATWMDLLDRHSEQLMRVTYFADDDIPGIEAAEELPAKYVEKTACRYREMFPVLQKLVTDLAVSTPELARRYSLSESSIWHPSFVCGPQPATKTVKYFYHGTESHLREIEWLVPLVREIQKRFPEAWFEVMSDTYVKKLFHGIPRVRSLHPMPWKEYLEYTTAFPQQVGLAPMLDTPFNLARSHVKLFDITRTGAAGIYSFVGPYKEQIVHDGTGLLLPNDHSAWIEAVTRLLRSPDECRRIHGNALVFCKKQVG